ncbi:MAG: penicillin acylase family protein [Polyangiaceae bacterium]|nr:penicillin acylase family protein [Polyangiaceae bacterium]
MRTHLGPGLLALVALAGLPACSEPTFEPRGPLGELLPVDGVLALDGLGAPVDVVRDRFGRVHVYARSLEDALRAQGYMVAADRTQQLDLLRRVATGRMAEILGHVDSSLIDTDIAFRQLGLARVAAEQYAALGPELRAPVDAFAAGVSQAFAEIRAGTRRLPDGLEESLGLVDASQFVPFTPIDALAVGRLQTWLLSYSGDDELETARLRDAMVATFGPLDPDPAVALRAHLERDWLRFAPPEPATTLPPGGASAAVPPPPGASPPAAPTGFHAAPAALAATDGFVQALRRARALFAPAGDFGSNNWAIAASRSATGHALLASDPHLGLGSPAILWPVSLHVHPDAAGPSEGDVEIGGLAFPGVPGIILGHNRHVAWGATVAGYDVTDVYAETVSADGSAVRFEGADVPLDTLEEVILVKDGAPVVYPVALVPHHGPIIPTIVNHVVQAPSPAEGALSVRWTGHEPTGELEAIERLWRARDVDEAQAAFATYGTGAQNWMLADDAGAIAWTSQALVPKRAPGALAWDAATQTGTLPCFVLPGEGGAEWTGFREPAEIPGAASPLAGFLATANNDPTGGTLDNDPTDETLADGSSAFLACRFDPGFREGRIQARIAATAEPFTLEMMSALQGDARSPLGARLVPPLLAAIDDGLAELETPGTHPELAGVVADPTFDPVRVALVRDAFVLWRDGLDFAAESGVDAATNESLPLELSEARAAQATAFFNAWLVRMLGRVFHDEAARLGFPSGTPEDIRALLHLFTADPATLATYDAAAHDSALFDDLDTPERETRQERMLRALADALADLAAAFDSDDVTTYRWGRLHTVKLVPDIPLQSDMAVPPPSDATFGGGFPRHGDVFGIDASNFSLRQSLGSAPSFRYRSGPVQRFVVELDPAGPHARNAIAGGNVWDPASPHHGDEMELWRRNQVHDVPFSTDEVVAAYEWHAVAVPAPGE